MASLVVTTGGTRLGIRMARPKCLAVNGSTALSIAPSRTCRCQSSGLRMVMRVVISCMRPNARRASARAVSADGRRGCGVGFARRFVDHGAGEIGDTGKAALGAPRFEPVDDGDDARRIAENELAVHDSARAGARLFDHS